MINSTLCYIENENGEYLMLHRVKKKGDMNQDKWLGVGGKFEDGESPDECLLREVREETGLTLTDYRYRAVVTFVSDKWDTEYMHLFTATGYTGEIRECDEGNLEWVPKSRVQELPIWEGDKLFFRLIDDRNSPFFSLKLRYEGETLVYAALDGKELKEKLLISACLTGENCKYNGGNNYIAAVEQLKERYELFPVCPEQDGGLPTPRESSERLGNQVVSRSGNDVTTQFLSGAQHALDIALKNGCKLALLKERSPSCGCGAIYDGSFSGTVIEGDGVTAELLKQHGIAIYGESRIQELLR